MDKIFDVTSTLKELIGNFVAFIPNLLLSIIFLILGFIVAKLLNKGLEKIFNKIGIDKLGEKINEIDFLQKNNIQIKLSSVIAKTFYYLVLLLFILLSVNALGLDVLTQQLDRIINYIPNFFTAAIILLVGLLVSEAARKGIDTTLRSLGVPSAGLISAIVFYFLIINIFLTALSQAKFDTEFIGQNITLIIGGLILAMALGYGLASKDLASNIIASFYSGKRIEVGDYITIGGVSGTVIEKGTSTISLDEGSEIIIIPLNKLTTEEIRIKKK